MILLLSAAKCEKSANNWMNPWQCMISHSIFKYTNSFHRITFNHSNKMLMIIFSTRITHTEKRNDWNNDYIILLTIIICLQEIYCTYILFAYYLSVFDHLIFTWFRIRNGRITPFKISSLCQIHTTKKICEYVSVYALCVSEWMSERLCMCVPKVAR